MNPEDLIRFRLGKLQEVLGPAQLSVVQHQEALVTAEAHLNCVRGGIAELQAILSDLEAERAAATAPPPPATSPHEG